MNYKQVFIPSFMKERCFTRPISRFQKRSQTPFLKSCGDLILSVLWILIRFIKCVFDIKALKSFGGIGDWRSLVLQKEKIFNHPVSWHGWVFLNLILISNSDIIDDFSWGPVEIWNLKLFVSVQSSWYLKGMKPILRRIEYRFQKWKI